MAFELGGTGNELDNILIELMQRKDGDGVSTFGALADVAAAGVPQSMKYWGYNGSEFAWLDVLDINAWSPTNHPTTLEGYGVLDDAKKFFLPLSNESKYVHLDGEETISGYKKFSHSKGMQIGDAVLLWDGEKNMIKFKNAVTGKVVNLVATGDVVALGEMPEDSVKPIFNFHELYDIEALGFGANDNGKTVVWDGSKWVKGKVGSELPEGIATESWVNNQGFLKGDVVTSIGLSGDNLSWYKNSVKQPDITIPYASRATDLVGDIKTKYYNKQDNGGRFTLQIIADVTEWYGKTEASKTYGFTGTIYMSRDGGWLQEKVINIIARCGWGNVAHMYQSGGLELHTTSNDIVPVLIKIDKSCYLALKQKGGGRLMSMIGKFSNCLDDFEEKEKVNDVWVKKWEVLEYKDNQWSKNVEELYTGTLDLWEGRTSDSDMLGGVEPQYYARRNETNIFTQPNFFQSSIVIDNDVSIYGKIGSDWLSLFYFNPSDGLWVGRGVADNKKTTSIDGGDVVLKYGHTAGLYLSDIGNVGIGTTSPTSKLHVNGNALIGGTVSINGITLSYDAAHNALVVDGNIIAKKDVIALGTSGEIEEPQSVTAFRDLVDVQDAGEPSAENRYWGWIPPSNGQQGHFGWLKAADISEDRISAIARSVNSDIRDMINDHVVNGNIHHTEQEIRSWFANSFLTQSVADGRYVGIANDQTITGYKTFSHTNGIRIGDAVLKVEGNVLHVLNANSEQRMHLCASGDVVALGMGDVEEQDKASYFHELLDNAIQNPNDYDYTGKAWGYDGTSWGFVEAGKTYVPGTGITINDNTISVDTNIIPTTLPASDVYAWAKQPTKPSYNTSEIAELGNLYFTDVRAQAALSGHTGDSTIHITSAERASWNNKWDWNENTIKGVTVNNATNASMLQDFRSPSRNIKVTWSRTDMEAKDVAWNSVAAWGIIDENTCMLGVLSMDKMIVGSAKSATKLETPRTIWGKSFNGTADIDANMSQVGHIYLGLIQNGKDTYGEHFIGRNGNYGKNETQNGGAGLLFKYDGNRGDYIGIYDWDNVGDVFAYYHGKGDNAQPTMQFYVNSIFNRAVEAQSNVSVLGKLGVGEAPSDNLPYMFNVRGDSFLNGILHVGSPLYGGSVKLEYDYAHNALRVRGTIIADGDIVALGGIGTIENPSVEKLTVGTMTIDAITSKSENIMFNKDIEFDSHKGINSDVTINGDINITSGSIYLADEQIQSMKFVRESSQDYIYITINGITKHFQAV